MMPFEQVVKAIEDSGKPESTTSVAVTPTL
jgi:hypothetical protein